MGRKKIYQTVAELKDARKRWYKKYYEANKIEINHRRMKKYYEKKETTT